MLNKAIERGRASTNQTFIAGEPVTQRRDERPPSPTMPRDRMSRCQRWL